MKKLYDGDKCPVCHGKGHGFDHAGKKLFQRGLDAKSKSNSCNKN
jgi:hypothetical protein